jgi:hypothetical protein
VKQQFHILFAGALLLGSLIIFHNQNSEPAGNISEFSHIELTELAAELPLQYTGETPVKPVRLHSSLLDQIFSAHTRNASFPHAATCQIRMKKQMDIYLEQKPVLEFRSGQYPCQPSSYGDPPGFIS